MAFAGGVYTLPAGNPVVTATTITSSWANTTMADIATALSTCVLKDGTQTLTANLPMGGFKLTGLGAGTAATDSVRVSQLQNSTTQYLTGTTGTNTITASGSPTVTALAAGQVFRFIPANTNTGATTLQIDSTAATNIFWNNAAMVGGEIRQNVPVEVFYDGTQYQLVGSAAMANTFAMPDTLRIQAAGDRTKQLAVSLTGITTATTRTWTAPDQNLNLIAFTNICDGRLTLTSGTPVTTADVTGATTLYFTPYKGNKIATYNSGAAAWNVYPFTQQSVAVPATTITPFDVFIVDSTLALETVNWSSDTVRATALAVQDGVYVKSGLVSRRYLGTCRTTASSGQTQDSASNRFVWNYYNRVLRDTETNLTADRTTTSGTFTETNSEIRSNFVLGVAEDCVFAGLNGTGDNDSAGATFSVALAFDSTSSADAKFTNSIFATAAAIAGGSISISGVKIGLAAGFHFCAVLFASPNGSNTVRLRGGASSAGDVRASMTVGLWG